MLLNRSFEDPVAPDLGNNFYATIPNWNIANVSPPQATPFNIVRPSTFYSGNPSEPPVGGGIQYLDLRNAAGTLQQSVTLPAAGMISISGWYSVRDFPQNLSGLSVRVRNSGGAIVASASVSFSANEPTGLWKQASATFIAVPTGTYTFEADMVDFSNIDLVSLFYYPPLSVTRSSYPLSDPINGTANPKLIPQGIAAATISVTCPNIYNATSDSIVATEPTPPNLSLMVNDGGAGTGPVSFSTGASTTTLTYAGLGSQTDDIDFSSDGGNTWTYVPTPGTDGSDPLVTNIRVHPKGAMAAGSTIAILLRYLIR